MDDKKEIIKKQMQIYWDYSKTEADIHSRVYLQIFVVLLTLGFSFILAGLTEYLKSISAFTIIAGLLLILASSYYVNKINELTDKLSGIFEYIVDTLEKLK